ncbi:MAG TPA: 50S ribosomal protein L9 [Coriobacteriia bacterium]
MKVILTAEVKGKGHEGDIVDVARGYAVNYLMPRKMAIVATTGNIKQLEARMNNIQKRNTARLTDAEAIAASIEGKRIMIEAKAGQDGKLFGSVTALMIEEAAAAQLGVDIDHKRMNLARPIKTTGEHVVVVSVFGDVKASLTVKVVGEGGAAEAAAAAAVVEVAEVEAPEAETEAVETEEVVETVEAEGDADESDEVAADAE